jgi:hypothetical protein
MKISVLENEMNQGPTLDDLAEMTRYLAQSLMKKNLALPPNKATIQAAKQIAKQYKVRFQDILARIRPSGAIKGDKAWDRFGNIVPWEKVFGQSSLKFTGTGRYTW